MGHPKNPHAVALGKRGGKVTSEAKAEAARENGKKGGRPRSRESHGQKKNPPKTAGFESVSGGADANVGVSPFVVRCHLTCAAVAVTRPFPVPMRPSLSPGVARQWPRV